MDDAIDDSEGRSKDSPLLTCAFNQDGSCMAVGTTTGFSVHNLHPSYAVSVNRPLQGGIGRVEMLFRCNLMALVGGGPSPHAPPHKVLVWDDHVPKEIGELSFRQPVLSVRMRKDAIAVSLQDRVYVYHLEDLTLRDKIYTAENRHGLLCLSTQIQEMVLACPSVTPGHVRVELYGLRKTVLMEAHESALRGLALTADGTKLATASVKGTVIRVWDVASTKCIAEFRRGVERVSITCLSFSWNYEYLACTSDKGTAHVFSLKDVEPKTPSSNSMTERIFTTVRRSMEGDAKKSICQIRGVPHPQACAFVSDTPNLLAIAGWDADGNGVVLLSEFSPEQEARRVGYHTLCRSSIQGESEEARRRRRLRGWTPEIPETPEGGRLYVGDRVEVLEKGMEQIQFEETDEFVSVTSIRPPNEEPPISAEPPEEATNTGEEDADNTTTEAEEVENTPAAVADSGTVSDSVRTEPLEDTSDNTASVED